MSDPPAAVDCLGSPDVREKENIMKTLRIAIALFTFLFGTPLVSYAQVKAAAAVSSAKETHTTNAKAAAGLARATYAVQGGDKFRNLKSYGLSGEGLAISPIFSEPVPMQFTFVTTSDRIRIDIGVSFGNIQLINDGKQFYNLVNGRPASFGIAPPSKFGLGVLARYDQPGYTVAALPEQTSASGFRITDAEGNSTDFYVDAKTGRITRLVYQFNSLKQEWEFTSFKEVEGVLVPQNFTFKMESKTGPYLLAFNAENVKINPPVSDKTFAP